ncbi:thioredoxin-like domain-containing protein [Ferruginibacter yonginensis]|uniref:Thioredoxin-like domain-containing protein n=1 Tax=Ferruginibacter yonginensis TaxID=1310416 RepID=A0ABV8QN65_9BACT
MKQFLLLVFISPLLATAQVKRTTSPSSKNNVVNPKRTVVNKTKTAIKGSVDDGFSISGTIDGLTDGTPIKLLNGNNGAEEQTAIYKNGTFSFKGKVNQPDFKAIAVNGQPPYLTLFIDNSAVQVKGSILSLENATVTGSASHNDFMGFVVATKKYEDLFNGKGRFNVGFMDSAANDIEQFIKKHTGSPILPLAIYRHYQITGDYVKLEALFNGLPLNLQTTPIGNYLGLQVAQNKEIPYGKPLGNFTQADTSGVEISLASFKGKYVLVDFWASWCGPCRAENPNVVNTFEKFKDKNFTVLGVSLDRDKQAWINAIATDKLTWTQVSDLKYWGNAVAQQFGIQSIPQNFLLDKEGNLVGKNLRGAALEYRLSKVIGQ